MLDLALKTYGRQGPYRLASHLTIHHVPTSSGRLLSLQPLTKAQLVFSIRAHAGLFMSIKGLIFSINLHPLLQGAESTDQKWYEQFIIIYLLSQINLTVNVPIQTVCFIPAYDKHIHWLLSLSRRRYHYRLHHPVLRTPFYGHIDTIFWPSWALNWLTLGGSSIPWDKFMLPQSHVAWVHIIRCAPVSATAFH
jgi:hypothetical protein